MEERIYLGGFEIFRKKVGNSLELERETLHIMDDKRRIAVVETLTVNNGAAVNSPVPVQRYQFSNNIESATLELDENANIISYEEYYPYGETSYRAGRNVAEVGLKRYRYTGKEKDEESGLYYYGARYYAPWLGRWTAADPAGISNQNIHNDDVELKEDNLLENMNSIKEFLNLYLFVQCNPIIRIDSDGYYSMRQMDDGGYERVPENEDFHAFNTDRVDAVFMNEEWMQEQMMNKNFNPYNEDLTDEIRNEWAEMARIVLNNEDVIADIANRSEKIEHGVFFNSERKPTLSFKLHEGPVIPFTSEYAAKNFAPKFTLQTKSVPDVGKLITGYEHSIEMSMPTPRKENEVHAHPNGIGRLGYDDLGVYENPINKHNMFVVGAQIGEVAVINRRIEGKFGLKQLPIGFIAINDKRFVDYKK